MFDPENFLQTETQETGETSYTPIPEDEYTAVIKDLKSNVTPNGNAVLNVVWLVDDQAAKEFTGMDEPTVRQSVWLDIDANGNLEFGPNKNIDLNRLRDALGQNDGSPWKPADMLGQVARIYVKHSAPNDKGDVYANVSQVSAA